MIFNTSPHHVDQMATTWWVSPCLGHTQHFKLRLQSFTYSTLFYLHQLPITIEGGTPWGSEFSLKMMITHCKYRGAVLLLYLFVGHNMYEYPLFFVVSHPFLTTFSRNHRILIIIKDIINENYFFLTRKWVEHGWSYSNGWIPNVLFFWWIPYFFVHTLAAYSYYSQLLLRWWYHQQLMIPKCV